MTRANITIGIGALVVLSVLLMAYLVLSPSPTPSASADEAVSEACADFERGGQLRLHGHGYPHGHARGRDHDHHLPSRRAGVRGRLERHLSVDGKVGSFNFMRVDGVGYLRLPDADTWEVSEQPYGEIGASLHVLGEDHLCPSTTGFRELGTETLDGEQVKHYTDAPQQGAGGDRRAQSGQTPSTDTNEFWVNEDGRLVQFGYQDTETITYAGYAVPPKRTITGTTSFSGVGETNTITAPVLP